MISTQSLKLAYQYKKVPIRERIAEFENLRDGPDNKTIFRELVFCILTAGTSAEMGIKVVEEIGEVIFTGSVSELKNKLKGIYRFYNIRSDYIVHTREYLTSNYGFNIRELLDSFINGVERRDFLALNRNIRGIGFKEASHFLRNIGYKGYAILDKHVVNALCDLGVIGERKPPSNRKDYLEMEKKYKRYAERNGFDIDELDLLIWSEKTGKILK